MIIGIDPSWSNFAIAGLPLDRTEPYEPYTRLSHYPPQERRFFDAGWDLYTAVSEMPDVELAIIENYAFGSKFGREMAGEIGALVKYTLESWEIPYILVAPTTLKKYATGLSQRKPSTKVQVGKGVAEKWNFTNKSNDIVDAYVLARIGLTLYLDEKPSLAYEAKIIRDLMGKYGDTIRSSRGEHPQN